MKITIADESAHNTRKAALIKSFYAPFVSSTSVIPSKMTDIYVSALFPDSNYDIRQEVRKIRTFVDRYEKLNGNHPETIPSLVDTIGLWMRRGTPQSMELASKAVTLYLISLNSIANSLPQSGLFTRSDFQDAAASNMQLLLMSVNLYDYPQVSFLTSVKGMFERTPLREALRGMDPGIPNLIDEATKLIDQELRTLSLLGALKNARVTGESRDI